jgi:NitT/TauT family transport system permease protein
MRDQLEEPLGPLVVEPSRLEAEEEDLSREEAAARRKARRRRLLLYAASVVLLVVFWEVLSRVIPYKAIVSPRETFSRIALEFDQGELLTNLGFTMKRVAEAFSLAMVIGVVVGILIGSYRTVDALFSLWVTVFITIPGLIYLVIGYVAFGIGTDTGAILAVTAMVTPAVLVSIIQGTRALDRQLIEMARSYGHRRLTIVRRVVVPQLLPYIFGAARYALALTWHMVIFAEVIGRPNGFGFKIYFHYQTANIPGIWAYGISFVMVALLLEYGVMGTAQRYLFRWRQEAKL